MCDSDCPNNSSYARPTSPARRPRRRWDAPHSFVCPASAASPARSPQAQRYGGHDSDRYESFRQMGRNSGADTTMTSGGGGSVCPGYATFASGIASGVSYPSPAAPASFSQGSYMTSGQPSRASAPRTPDASISDSPQQMAFYGQRPSTTPHSQRGAPPSQRVAFDHRYACPGGCSPSSYDTYDRLTQQSLNQSSRQATPHPHHRPDMTYNVSHRPQTASAASADASGRKSQEGYAPGTNVTEVTEEIEENYDDSGADRNASAIQTVSVTPLHSQSSISSSCDPGCQGGEENDMSSIERDISKREKEERKQLHNDLKRWQKRRRRIMLNQGNQGNQGHQGQCPASSAQDDTYDSGNDPFRGLLF